MNSYNDKLLFCKVLLTLVMLANLVLLNYMYLDFSENLQSK